MATMDTISISLNYMKPGSMRQIEPREAAVEQEFLKRKRLDPTALAENTLTLATRNPIMLLRVRQKEHQHKAASRGRQFWMFSKAKEYQQRMKARKIFDGMMQEANAWRSNLAAQVGAVRLSHEMDSDSDMGLSDEMDSASDTTVAEYPLSSIAVSGQALNTERL